MMQFTARDQEQLRGISGSLLTLDEERRSIFDRLLPELRELLGLEIVLAYGVRRGTETFELSFAHSAGFPRGRERLRDELGVLVSSSRVWGLYDPEQPEPAQRNLPYACPTSETSFRLAQAPRGARRRPSRAELSGITRDPNGPAAQFFRSARLDRHWQLRVLVCEGSSLLGWVGGFRTEPVGPREVELLRALTPALRQRLSLERLLDRGAFGERALSAMLEDFSRPAFIVASNGRVDDANSLGRQLLAAKPGETRTALTEALGVPNAGPSGFRVTPLGLCGATPLFLVVANGAPRLEDRARGVAVRWGLTPRQTEVLTLILTGAGNKGIASTLRCAERTVEVHVTALLMKVQVESRSALAARFWAEP